MGLLLPVFEAPTEHLATKGTLYTASHIRDALVSASSQIKQRGCCWGLYAGAGLWKKEAALLQSRHEGQRPVTSALSDLTRAGSLTLTEGVSRT